MVNPLGRDERKERLLNLVRIAGCTLQQAQSILELEDRSKARAAKLKHLKETFHGHTFDKGRYCSKCGLSDKIYFMEYANRELDKVVTCQDMVDLMKYNAYLGIGVYKPRRGIDTVSF